MKRAVASKAVAEKNRRKRLQTKADRGKLLHEMEGNMQTIKIS
jgi:hypothetical protein